MFQPNIRLANFLLAEYPDEYPAGWYLVDSSSIKLKATIMNQIQVQDVTGVLITETVQMGTCTKILTEG